MNGPLINEAVVSGSSAGGVGSAAPVSSFGRRLAAWLAGFVLAALFLPPAQGQPASVRPVAGHRWLLVIESSAPMKRRATAALKTVDDLLASGMRGQLRTGDTLGVWTFNETLSPTRLPLQTWSPGERQAISNRVHAFIQGLTWEKTPALESLMPAILRLVEGSSALTVVLVSSGEAKIQGTPFDERINRFFETWQATQRKTRTPFVTVLRGANGKLTEVALTPAQWEVDLPSLPPERRMAQPAPTPKAQPAPVAPLILTGKKPKPDETAAAPAPTEPPKLAPAPEPRPAPVVQPKPEPSPPPGAETGNGPPLAGGSGELLVAREPPPAAAAPDRQSASQANPATPPEPAPATSPPQPEPAIAPPATIAATPPSQPAAPATEERPVPAPAPLAAVAAGTPVASPPGNLAWRLALGLAGLLFAAGGLGFFVLRRRSLAAGNQSLIRQSMEQGKRRQAEGKKPGQRDS